MTEKKNMKICVQKVGLIMNALVVSSMTSVMEHSRSTFHFIALKEVVLIF